VPYVHGGYAAAAPLFVNDARFAHVLRQLLPAAYEELGCLLKKGGGGGGVLGGGGGGRMGGGGGDNDDGAASVASTSSTSPSSADLGVAAPAAIHRSSPPNDVVLRDPVKVMKWAENNPVVSAFGMWNSDSGRRTIHFDRNIRLHQRRTRRQRSNRRRSHEGGGDGDAVVDRDIDDDGGGWDFGDKNEDDAEAADDDDDDDDVDADDQYSVSVITIGSGNFGYRNFGSRGYDHGHLRDRPRRGAPSSSSPSYSGGRRHPLPPPAASDDGAAIATPMMMAGGRPRRASSVPRHHHHHHTPDERPRYDKPALEWDLFLDPVLVRRVDAALGIVDALDLKLRKARIKRERRRIVAANNAAAASSKSNHHRSDRRDENYGGEGGGGGGGGGGDDDEDDFDLSQSHTAAQVEVDRLVSQRIRRTIIAHGSMSQLVLEAMGVAQKYNYRTVVRSSRDGSTGGGGNGAATRGPSTPSRSQRTSRSGTSSWDEEEERRDFEALLDPTTLGSGGGGGGDGGSSKTDNNGGMTKSTRRNAAKSAGGSKGMFMETWLHVFARTLSLLVKSSSASCGGGGGGAAVPEANSSSSGNCGRDWRRLAVVENRPADIGQRGFSGLLEKIFLRRDSSYSQVPGRCVSPVAIDEDRVSDFNNVNDAPDDFRNNDDSELLTNDDMLSPATSPTASSAFGNLCGASLCFGGAEDCVGAGSVVKRGSKASFPTNPHASHKMAQDVERISAVLGEPLRLVLDLKSRRVPPRVWCRLIDSLRTRGLVIEGIGSFDMDESRSIGRGCSCPLNPFLFFHSVGDLQRACHANEVSVISYG
jgi:hypothetical protein